MPVKFISRASHKRDGILVVKKVSDLPSHTYKTRVQENVTIFCCDFVKYFDYR